MASRTITKYFSWSWTELDGPERAAFAETWSFDGSGALVARRRIPLAKTDAGGPTVSTDPRAAAIMREELGLAPRREMAGPH
jgi:hypothetical protein